MKSLAIGRIIGLFLGIVGLGISIACAHTALDLNKRYHDSLTARPMEATIDLSRPGEITVPFRQTCSMSHGEFFYFQCDSEEKALLEPNELFAGVAGRIVIKSTSGDEIASVTFDEKSIRKENGKFVLASIVPYFPYIGFSFWRNYRAGATRSMTVFVATDPEPFCN